MQINEGLKRLALARFAGDEVMKNALLKKDEIFWRTKEVQIQDVLLTKMPSRRRLSKRAYSALLRRWKRGFIGGVTKLERDCNRRSWHPPRGARLYQIEYKADFSGMRKYEYFILEKEGEYHLLVNRFDGFYEFRVIRSGYEDPHINKMLTGIWIWEPKVRDLLAAAIHTNHEYAGSIRKEQARFMSEKKQRLFQKKAEELKII